RWPDGLSLDRTVKIWDATWPKPGPVSILNRVGSAERPQRRPQGLSRGEPIRGLAAQRAVDDNGQLLRDVGATGPDRDRLVLENHQELAIEARGEVVDLPGGQEVVERRAEGVLVGWGVSLAEVGDLLGGHVAGRAGGLAGERQPAHRRRQVQPRE